MSRPDFVYQGPSASFASLTGSPLWAVPIDTVVARWTARGWSHEGGSRVDTPYGLGPEVHRFTTAGGRAILWIPSYGDIIGEAPVSHETLARVFWILWQAGVKVLLIGGNAGICDPRGLDGVQPGDLVLPWSFRTHREHRGLPGTPFAAPWPRHNLLLDEPFCPALRSHFVALARPHETAGRIRRIHTPETLRAALVQVETITFESDFDVLVWLALNRAISAMRPDLPPVVTLHGDCVNPILARFLGLHVCYYQLVSNFAQGIATGDEIHAIMTRLYTHDYPSMVLDLEARMLESAPLPSPTAACHCARSLHANPDQFIRAITGGREL